MQDGVLWMVLGTFDYSTDFAFLAKRFFFCSGVDLVFCTSLEEAGFYLILTVLDRFWPSFVP